MSQDLLMEYKKFSVILIIRDDINLLTCCLASLNRLDYPREHFEVIVVDDGSDKPVFDKIDLDLGFQFHPHYIPRTTTSSRSKARNKGAELANHEHLVFIDGDHFVEKSLLSVYNNYFQLKPKKEVVLGKRRHIAFERWPVIQNKILHNEEYLPSKIRNTLYLEDERTLLLQKSTSHFQEFRGRWHLFWTCNFCILKSTLSKVGNFDEHFIGWGMEDVELGYRLFTHHIEYEIIDNHIWHFLPENTITEEKYVSWVANLQYFFSKYGDTRILAQHSFENIFFYAATKDESINYDWHDAFVEFEKKIRLIEKHQC
ncbi:Hyaluronan synthase [Thalassocella blandensis]|nr:Hyaluronan synthase [Thalassocella blandensis]